MPTEQDVSVAAAVIAASPLIEPQYTPLQWMGLARRILEEVEMRHRMNEREQNERLDDFHN